MRGQLGRSAELVLGPLVARRRPAHPRSHLLVEGREPSAGICRHQAAGSEGSQSSSECLVVSLLDDSSKRVFACLFTCSRGYTPLHGQPRIHWACAWPSLDKSVSEMTRQGAREARERKENLGVHITGASRARRGIDTADNRADNDRSRRQCVALRASKRMSL